MNELNAHAHEHHFLCIFSRGQKPWDCVGRRPQTYLYLCGLRARTPGAQECRKFSRRCSKKESIFSEGKINFEKTKLKIADHKSTGNLSVYA